MCQILLAPAETAETAQILALAMGEIEIRAF
jgi:hypothetical protein